MNKYRLEEMNKLGYRTYPKSVVGSKSKLESLARLMNWDIVIESNLIFVKDDKEVQGKYREWGNPYRRGMVRDVFSYS